MNSSKNPRRTTLRLCVTGLMAAIVFAGNYLRITIPVSLGGVTSFTLANILCALSGILLGPWWGFLSAGVGSAIYDLTNPVYIMEAPITLLTKGIYGFMAGLILRRLFSKAKGAYHAQLVATVCAALTYMVIYSIKVFFYNGMLIQGFTEPLQCWMLVVSKLPATLFNGIIAIVAAPVLGVALRKAIHNAHMENILPE